MTSPEVRRQRTSVNLENIRQPQFMQQHQPYQNHNPPLPAHPLHKPWHPPAPIHRPNYNYSAASTSNQSTSMGRQNWGDALQSGFEQRQADRLRDRQRQRTRLQPGNPETNQRQLRYQEEENTFQVQRE